VFRDGGPERYCLSEVLRAALHEVPAKDIPIAIDWHPTDHVAHPDGVEGHGGLPSQRGVLRVDWRPDAAAQSHRGPLKCQRPWGEGEARDGVDVGVGEPEAGIDGTNLRLGRFSGRRERGCSHPRLGAAGEVGETPREDRGRGVETQEATHVEVGCGGARALQSRRCLYPAAFGAPTDPIPVPSEKIVVS
jgi:hypothetical protein